MSDDNFKGIPKTSQLYYTGKGKLDEKSFIKSKEYLYDRDLKYYNIGDTLSTLDTGDIYKLLSSINDKGETILKWYNVNDCGTW